MQRPCRPRLIATLLPAAVILGTWLLPNIGRRGGSSCIRVFEELLFNAGDRRQMRKKVRVDPEGLREEEVEQEAA